MRKLAAIFLALFALLTGSACHQLDDDRIPHMAVHIDLSNQGLWNTYGVNAYGQFNNFIFTTSLRIPSGFPYTYNSATGYGGVLLICGQNPYTGDIGPLAYDLSCPVERMPDIRVYVDLNNYQAVCPDCGSHYDIVEAGGAPLSGPAAAMHYALTPYQCYPTLNGGFIISD